MTHILMKIKFSPRLDVPGFLEVNKINVTVTMPELFVSAYAFTGDYPVHFNLAIKTYKFMNQHGSSWSKIEMGNLFLEILKSPSPYVWRNIHSEEFYDAPNQYIWWDMYYRYRDSMEAGFGLLEDFERKREDNENKALEREDQLIEDHRYIAKITVEEKKLL